MLKSLTAVGFRNLEITDFKPSASTTILVGENGQGKTNILEAIYFLSYAKPFRGQRDEVIAWNEKEALIVGETEEDSLRLQIREETPTKVVLNGKKRGVAQVLGRFVSVLFHPGEIQLLVGAPQLRRLWLDRLVSTIDHKYLVALISYNRALKNRNALLKAGQTSPTQLEVWDEQLARLGTNIWITRQEVVETLNKVLKKDSPAIIGKVTYIDYKIPFPGSEKGEWRRNFLKALVDSRPLDERLKNTVFGPHRDDFKLVMEVVRERAILEKDIGTFGSRAEQRQATILLNLAQARVFSESLGKLPTLLLDDVTSELDQKNRQLLLSHLGNRQTIITTTNTNLITPEILKRATVYKVEGGRITAP